MARVAPQKSRSWSIFYRMNEVRQEGSSPVTDVPLLGGQDGNDHNDNAGEEMAVIARSTSANFSSRPGTDSSAENALIKAHQGRLSRRMND